MDRTTSNKNPGIDGLEMHQEVFCFARTVSPALLTDLKNLINRRIIEGATAGMARSFRQYRQEAKALTDSYRNHQESLAGKANQQSPGKIRRLR